MSVEARLSELGLELPEVPTPAGAYTPGVIIGDLLFLSGQTPKRDGLASPVGRVGAEVTLDEAADAARQAMLQSLAAARSVAGTLDRIERVVRVAGFVRSAPGFDRQSAVVDGASKLLADVFGDAGVHSRSSIGVAELPGGAAVEVEAVFSLRS